MFLQEFELRNFRNHSACRLSPTGRHLVLYGANGAGKTNILDALSLLTPGRGLRHAAHGDAVGKSNPTGGWAVEALFSGSDGEFSLTTGVRPDQPGRRLARIDGADASLSHFGDHVAVTWLTPKHDRLFVDAASERRRFLDRLVLSLFPDHAQLASRFERLNRERIRILEMGSDDQWLRPVEAQLAAAGMGLAQNRAEWARMIAEDLQIAFEGFPGCGLEIIKPFGPLLGGDWGGMAQHDDYAVLLAERRGQDREAGRLLVGPHRADLAACYREKDMPADQCSTGEQKALLVSILLAHIRILRAAKGKMPILVLMDEIAAHFDPNRRHALAGALTGLHAQAFLTGTEARLFEDFGENALFVSVADGKVSVRSG